MAPTIPQTIAIPFPAPITLTGLFSIQSELLEPNINTAVATAQAALVLSPPGAVQSGIDFTALGNASLDFVQLAGDVGNVFCQDFEAVITEGLAVAQLVVSIISAATAAGAGAAP
jgi:hypothetical protein